MAPGDKMFHLVSFHDKKNKMNNFKTRLEAEKRYIQLGKVPKLLMSGETGDVLLSHGD
jgi:vancomycin permeability regulator SanA